MSSKSSPTVDAHEHGSQVSTPENENDHENGHENEHRSAEAGRKKFTLLSFWEEKERSSRHLAEGKSRPTPTTANISMKSSHSSPQSTDDSFTKEAGDGPRKTVKETESVKVVVFPPLPPSNAVFKDKYTELEKESKSSGNGSSEVAVLGDESKTKHVSFMLGCDGGISGEDRDRSSHNFSIAESEVDTTESNSNNKQEGVLKTLTTTKDSHDTSSSSTTSMSENKQDIKSTKNELAIVTVEAAEQSTESFGSVMETGLAPISEDAEIQNTAALEQSLNSLETLVDKTITETQQISATDDVENGFKKNKCSDDSTQIILEVTASEPWWKKNRNAIFFIIFVLVIISATVTGLVFSPNPSESNITGSNEQLNENALDSTPETSEVADDFRDVVSVETLSPSSFPSNTASPTTANIVMPSSMPSLSPTGCVQQVSEEADQLSFDPSGNSTYTKIATDGTDLIAATESGDAVFYSLTNNGVWKLMQEINSGQHHNYSSVAISNGIAVIGHPYANETGRIHVYERNETSDSWNEIEEILFANVEGEIGGGFGWSVGVSSSNDGELLVVGAPFENEYTVSRTFSVSVSVS